MSARHYLLALVATAALGAVPAGAQAKAPSKSDIDAAVMILPDDAKGGITEASDKLQGAEGALTDAKTALAAAKLMQEAERLRLSEAESELKAISAEQEAAELQGETAQQEALAVEYARTLTMIEWRKSRLDANKLLIQYRNADMNTAKQLVAQREAELEREKLEAMANNGGDPDVGTAAGKAFQAAARKRKATLRSVKTAKKVEKKWERADRVAEKQKPKDGSNALRTAYDSSLKEKDAQVAEAREQVEAERTKTAELQQRLDDLEEGQAQRVEELQQTTSKVSAESDSRVTELTAQIEKERTAHEAELAQVREEMAKDAGTGAAKEIAALQSDLSSSKEKQKELDEKLTAVTAERDATAGKIAELESRLAGAETSGDDELVALREQVASAVREQEAAVAAAEEEADNAKLESERLQGRVTELLTELTEAQAAAAQAGGDDKEDMMALIASLKRQLSQQKATSDEQLALLQRQLSSEERKNDARVVELAAALELERGQGDGLAQAVADAERDRDAVMGELERTKSQRDEESAQVTRLESKLADQKADFERRVDELKGAVEGADQANAELKAVQAELEATKSELATAKTEAKASRDAAAASNGKLAEAKSQVTTLTAAIEKEQASKAEVEAAAQASVEEASATVAETNEEKALLAEEVTTLKAQVKASEERRAKEIAEAVAAARAEEADDEALRAEIELSLAGAEARSAELEAELVSIQLRYQAMERELTGVQSALDDKEIAQAELNTKLGEMTKRMRDLDQESKGRIAWLTAELSFARNSIGGQRDRIAQLEESQRERDRSIARLMAENKSLWARIDGN